MEGFKKTMRCLSPHRNYSIQVIEGKESIVVDARGFATTVELNKPFIANFAPSGLTDWEELAVYEKFNFSGLAEGVNPLTTVGVWDVETACMAFPKSKREELYVQVCQRMRDLAEQYPDQFICVTPPAAEIPWPKYDELGADEIQKFQEALGIDPDLIRLYELENENRADLVIAMLQLTDPQAAARLIGVEEADDTEDSPQAKSEADVAKLQELYRQVDPPEEKVIVDA